MEKKKFRLNIIDWVIILVVVAGAAFGVYKYLGSRETDVAPKKYKYTLIMDNFDVADDAYGNGKLKEGDKVIEKSVNANLGDITSIDIKPSKLTVTTSEGEVVQATRPGSSWVTITVEGEGVFSSTGALTINGTQYYRNKSFEVMIDGSAFWWRLVEIEKVEIS